MRKLIVLIVFLSSLLSVQAGVSFKFDARSVGPSSEIKAKMEKAISSLLTEINAACQANRNLNLSSVDMESEAKNRLNAMWEMLPFVCEDDENVSSCLTEYNGYQVRGIKITMKPKDATYNQSIHRELTISLSKRGVITGVRPALEMQEDVKKIMSEGKDVADLTRRREILKWVEDFRNYYNERNIESLQKIYSEDALIITGSVIKKGKSKYKDDSSLELNEKYQYSKQSKTEYLQKLKRTFDSNKYLNVKFSNISVVKHGAKENIYGVTLKQDWTASNYSDEGWLFLLWDFNDPDNPQIHVRTWQPNTIVQTQGVFTLDDFFIP